jgi:hypothetical protein
MVGQLFAETGCDVRIAVTIETVRGHKEIDVHVQDDDIVPPALYLCECKYWKRAVPQEIVHSFRTVLDDVGAHRGFIISVAGFQQGAYEASKNTNIDLLSFAELQRIFFDRWRVSMGRRYLPYADLLFPYWDPSGGRMPRFRWNDQHIERHRRLVDAYQPLIHLGPVAEWEGYRRRFPIVLPSLDTLGHIAGTTSINSYRELYDFIDANKDLALYHFQVLHGEIDPDRSRGEYDPLV